MEAARRNPGRNRAAPGRFQHHGAQPDLQPRQRAVRPLRRISMSEFDDEAVETLKALQQAGSGLQHAQWDPPATSSAAAPAIAMRAPQGFFVAFSKL